MATGHPFADGHPSSNGALTGQGSLPGVPSPNVIRRTNERGRFE